MSNPKIPSYTNLYQFIPETRYKSWKVLEDEWPEDPTKKYLFYNPSLNLYQVLSIDCIEKSERMYAQNLSELMNNEYLDENVKYWVDRRHAYTHYMELPVPPEGE